MNTEAARALAFFQKEAREAAAEAEALFQTEAAAQAGQAAAAAAAVAVGKRAHAQAMEAAAQAAAQAEAAVQLAGEVAGRAAVEAAQAEVVFKREMRLPLLLTQTPRVRRPPTPRRAQWRSIYYAIRRCVLSVSWQGACTRKHSMPRPPPRAVVRRTRCERRRGTSASSCACGRRLFLALLFIALPMRARAWRRLFIARAKRGALCFPLRTTRAEGEGWEGAW
ncbi:hypothetical protein T492DRAFT_463251 [Pavlovales sp. CCMP2436]|nr:hypothetical protein T492DRAFT_463251 [Pavlovales sp. CCMP2436]